MEQIKRLFYVIIAGSRDYNNYSYINQKVTSVFDQLILNNNNTVIISGGARGVDQLAEKFAIENDFMFKEFLAQWEEFGKSAGIRRNLQMAHYASNFGKESDHAYLIAFWDQKSRGTKNMIDIAKKMKIKTFVFNTL